MDVQDLSEQLSQERAANASLQRQLEALQAEAAKKDAKILDLEEKLQDAGRIQSQDVGA